MQRLTDCRNECVYAQQKNRVWQAIAYHEGICTRSLAEWTNLMIRDVEELVEDLYVEDKVTVQKITGRWYPEMSPIY